MKTFAISVLSLLTGYWIGHYWLVDNDFHTPAPSLAIAIDTVIRRHTDTILITSPTYRERLSSRTVTLPCSTAVTHCDSDSVTLRTVTRVYSDSTYRAVVSGVRPSLDSLTLYHPACTITRTVTRHTPAPSVRTPSRWGLGITAGVTATRSGLSPGVTLGLTYRLLP